MSVIRRMSVAMLFLLICTGYSCPQYDREGKIVSNLIFDSTTNNLQWVVQYDDLGKIKMVALLPDRDQKRKFTAALFNDEGYLKRFVDYRGRNLESPATMRPNSEHVLGNDFFINLADELRIEIQARDTTELIHFGDSITALWRMECSSLYRYYYGDRNGMVMAIPGNRISNILYQLNDQSLNGLDPKVVIINIGTNDTSDVDIIENTAINNAWGIIAILARVTAKLPNSHIILMGIFPRGALIDNHRRLVNERVNALIAGFDDGERIHFRNINYLFLNEDASIKKNLFDIYILHPSPAGLALWAEEIEPLVNELFAESSDDTVKEKSSFYHNNKYFRQYWKGRHRYQ